VNGRNITNEELWSAQQSIYEKMHGPLLTKKIHVDLRKRNYDFKPVEKMWNKLHNQSSAERTSEVKNGNSEGKLGPVSDEDLVALKPNEMKKVTQA